jgi:hypothetical protein
MTPDIYRLIHVTGVLCLFLGLGGILGAGGGDAKVAKLFPVLHGVGLAAMLVAGIGFAHRSELGWPNWMLAKIACWVVIAAAPTLVRRGVLPRFLALLLVLCVGAAAAWLARAKPF